MGLLCDYFTAGSDAEAAATLDWIGGPSKPPAKKGLFSRKSGEGHPTLPLKGLEPTMWMGKLEELLTGRTFDEILDDPSGKIVASRDGGERLVLPITENLQQALGDLPDERLEEIGLQWATADEYYGTGGDPAVLGSALRDLRDLVRSGRLRSEKLYCWVCV